MRKENTIMYEALKRIYRNTKDETYLTNAVTKGWLTDEEKQQIMAEVSGENAK